MLQRLARLLFQACPSAQTAQLKRFLHTVVVPGGYGENLSVNLCDVPRELRLLAPPPAVPASPLTLAQLPLHPARPQCARCNPKAHLI